MHQFRLAVATRCFRQPLMDSLVSAANLGVAKAFLADIVGFDHRGRAFGIYGTAIGLASLPASFFAGFLWDHIGPRAPFLFGAGVAAVAAIILAFSAKRLGGEEGPQLT